jgi:hypothetical protein
MQQDQKEQLTALSDNLGLFQDSLERIEDAVFSLPDETLCQAAKYDFEKQKDLDEKEKEV